jgi:hypothetical protein
MKKIFAPLALSSVVLISSCANMEMKKIDINQLHQIEDSIPKIVPGTRSIHTLQHDDYSTVTVIVGSPDFYKADQARIQQAAVQAGMAILRIVGPGNNLSTAQLVITTKDSNEDKVPDDGKTADMKIDSLNKVLYPKK